MISKAEGNQIILGKFIDFEWRQRRILFNEINKRNPQILVEKQQIDGKDTLVAKFDPAALTPLQRKMKDIDSWVGFRHVIDHLARSNKPVVGHNSFLDWLFITQSFVADFQNADYNQYKEILKANFGQIFDTKVLMQTLEPTLLETSLEKVYKFVNSEEFTKKLPRQVTVNMHTSSESPHEAGYDAYMTGVIFAKQLAHASAKQATETYKNCIYLYGCDQSPMTIGREEDAVDLTRSFLVSEFDDSFTTDKIQADSRFGGETKVKWIDDTTCVVTVKSGDPKEVEERVKKLPDWKVVALSALTLEDLKEPPHKKRKS